MRVNQFNLLMLRHGPKPKPQRRDKKGKLPVQAAPLRTIVIEANAEGGVGAVTGLGEVRASAERFGESARDAWAIAPAVANALLGIEIDEQATGADLVEAVGQAVETAFRHALGIADAPLADSHRTSRFAFETTILDAAARSSQRSMRAILGGFEGPVPITVVNQRSTKPEDMISQLIGGDRRAAWIRVNSGTDVNGDLTTVNLASAGVPASADNGGVWINAREGWNTLRMERFLAGLRQFRQFRNGLASLIIEDPFPLGSNDRLAYYTDLLERWRASGELDVRLLLSAPFATAASMDGTSEVLSKVDIGLSPQRSGGVAELFRVVAQVRARGFAGRLHVENSGVSTDINTLMLASLASALPEARFNSAGPARQTRHPILDSRPVLQPNGELTVPPGHGLATRLQPETLPHRLDDLQVVTVTGVESGPSVRLRYLQEHAVGDGATSYLEGAEDDLLATALDEAGADEADEADSESGAEEDGDVRPNAPR